MIINLLNYLRGYVKIRLCGISPERFINLCSNRDILIWNLKSVEDTYEMYMSLKGFRQLRPIVRKTKMKIIVMERHGLPFFLHKYRKRKIFFMGALLCCGLIYTMSLFIWQIKIEGNYSRTTDVLLDFLEEENIYHGVWKSRVDCEQIETNLRLKYNDIIWASAQIKGTRLIISVQENTDTSIEKLENENPTDLLSNKNALITEMITRAGTPAVKIGQVVKEGDLLVSGRLEIIDDNGEIANYRYCTADADIYAKTVYEYQQSFPRKYKKKNYTSKQKTTYYVKCLENVLHIMKNKIKYKEYDQVTEEKQLKLGENFYLPFSFGTVTNREFITTNEVYTKKEAAQIAKELLQEYCAEMQDKGIKILENNVKIIVDEKECRAEGKILVEEKVGIRCPTEIVTMEKGTDSDEYSGNSD